MNKKIREIIGIIELSLFSIVPNYSLPQATTQMQQRPSALENIVENSSHEEEHPLYVHAPNASSKTYHEEGYRASLKYYMQQHIKSKEDMANRVPLKWLNILPESQMGGILGFTYLGDNSMGRRDDLTGKTARMVDIHESIHTPDEYETRVLTSWIMEKIKTNYKK